MLSLVRRTLKPLFYGALAGLVEARWRARRPGRPSGLPAPLVVSLTSYPKRFDALVPTLKTLLTQSVRPDAVLLWIADGDMEKLPSEIRAMEADGLQIRPTVDLRSYKKIIPALAEHSDAFIVTADDDVYYPRDWLATLCEAYVPGDRTILAHRAHRMSVENGRLLPYDRWPFEISDQTPGWDVFFTGVGGVFYPPASLHPDVGDVETLLALCPTGDDIWLNWMARRAGNRVRKVGPKRRFFEWPGSQDGALQTVNRGEGDGNDRQFAAIVARYGLPMGELAK
ncbi:glycosyltransferase family 2 protein [Aureimonas sp. ME7]|uniref:glycosyltransferase family 2 protein n=1 Tax=Aureimonas sp. ME7 TaxID=2744252 RepID=UPI0015F8712B|nr:glycosyltransferase family 2 protein [Aureimonas sp. ME7]